MNKKKDKEFVSKLIPKEKEIEDISYKILKDENFIKEDSIEVIESIPSPGISAKTDEEKNKDFEFVRKNLKGLTTTGKNSLKELLSLAQISEHPGAYKIIADLMKSILEVNKELLNIHKTSKEIEKLDNEIFLNENEFSTGTSNINNTAIFVGSTKELLENIKKIDNDGKKKPKPKKEKD